MKETLIARLAKDAKRDGLTLQWSIAHFMEKLERAEQRLERQSRRDTRAGDANAQILRLENEALALVLAAVLRAYPAGADITFE